MSSDILACVVGHLGLIAGIYDALGIGDVIDRALPKTRHHKISAFTTDTKVMLRTVPIRSK